MHLPLVHLMFLDPGNTSLFICDCNTSCLWKNCLMQGENVDIASENWTRTNVTHRTVISRDAGPSLACVRLHDVWVCIYGQKEVCLWTKMSMYIHILASVCICAAIGFECTPSKAKLVLCKVDLVNSGWDLSPCLKVPHEWALPGLRS